MNLIETLIILVLWSVVACLVLLFLGRPLVFGPLIACSLLYAIWLAGWIVRRLRRWGHNGGKPGRWA
jgi:hypothetical protein